jgi:hypothetical protein
MKKISTTLSILFLVAISVSAQSPPTLRNRNGNSGAAVGALLRRHQG